MSHCISRVEWRILSALASAPLDWTGGGECTSNLRYTGCLIVKYRPTRRKLKHSHVIPCLRSSFIVNINGRLIALCLFTRALHTNSRSEWQRGLKHEMPSPTQMQGSWVRIQLEAWVSVFILCLSYPVQGSDPPFKESYRLSVRLRNWSETKTFTDAPEGATGIKE
jgi:hypothetical protein